MSLKNYLLLDSGDGQKLEKVGKHIIVRPCGVAIWKPSLSIDQWNEAHAIFSRLSINKWKFEKNVVSSWIVEIEKIKFKVCFTDFGHLGIFPEHSILFETIQKKINKRKNANILNLFAYTGGVTLAAAKAGAKVCHLDASKPSVLWAKENAILNDLQEAPIRWIVDDVLKFLKREIKRGIKYDAIILDPPTFGRGKSGQVFKIEEHLLYVLELCKKLLSNDPLFLILSCHTPGYTDIVLKNVVSQILPRGKVESSHMYIEAKDNSIPAGSFAIWEPT